MPAGAHVTRDRLRGPLFVPEPMLAEGHYVASSEYSFVDPAGVDECAVRTAQVSQNTTLVGFDQLRMMLADKFALNLNVVVGTAPDGDDSITEGIRVRFTAIQSNEDPAILLLTVRHMQSPRSSTS